LDATVQSIWRHPVKGFTPEPLRAVTLSAGACFPFDRLYAVEDGPSGFNPETPAHISKQKFTVLAKIPAVAKVRTRFDEATGELEASFEGLAPIIVRDLVATCRQLAEAGQTIVVVEQNVTAALSFADRVYIINNGHIVESLTSQQVRATPEILHKYLGV
jgi:ABC-type histidine transport system ATPase subunit